MRHSNKSVDIPVIRKNQTSPLQLWSDTGVFDLYIHKPMQVSGEIFVISPEAITGKLTLRSANRVIEQALEFEKSPIAFPSQLIPGKTHVHLEFFGTPRVGLSLEVSYL